MPRALLSASLVTSGRSDSSRTVCTANILVAHRNHRSRMTLSTQTRSPSRWTADHPHYRWIALSNTTLGMLIVTINSSIVIISLPAIFRGIELDPLAPGNVGYLLWTLMGFMVVTAVLVVTLGRLGDMFGRVKIYNAGFVVFTVGSIALGPRPVQGRG